VRALGLTPGAAFAAQPPRCGSADRTGFRNRESGPVEADRRPPPTTPGGGRRPRRPAGCGVGKRPHPAGPTAAPSLRGGWPQLERHRRSDGGDAV